MRTMNYNEKEYLKRLVDKNIERYLEIFGAISVEGPKWCGKTWTASNHAKSFRYLDDENTKELALLDINLILNDDKNTSQSASRMNGKKPVNKIK